MNRLTWAFASVLLLSACAPPRMSARVLVFEPTMPAAHLRAPVRPARLYYQEPSATSPLRILLMIRAPHDSILVYATGERVRSALLVDSVGFDPAEKVAVEAQLGLFRQLGKLLPQRLNGDSVLPAAIAVVDAEDDGVATDSVYEVALNTLDNSCDWEEKLPLPAPGLRYVGQGETRFVCMKARITPGRASDRSRYYVQARWIAYSILTKRPGSSAAGVVTQASAVACTTTRETERAFVGAKACVRTVQDSQPATIPTVHTVDGEARILRRNLFAAFGIGIVSILSILLAASD